MDLQSLLAAPGSLALIAANILISVAAFNNADLAYSFSFDVGRVRQKNEWYRLLTSGFVHIDPFHLFVNMFSLVFLGVALEGGLGTVSFLGVYFGSLLGGSLWALLEHWREPSYRSAGASGAISGVTCAFALFAPFAMIVFIVVPMPAILFAVVFIAFSMWALRNAKNPIFGHATHLGGALTGIALVCIFWPGAVQNTWQQILGLAPR